VYPDGVFRKSLIQSFEDVLLAIWKDPIDHSSEMIAIRLVDVCRAHIVNIVNVACTRFG
jgi:hypothetical protein